jgi:DNA-binding transcriptional MerR regulator
MRIGTLPKATGVPTTTIRYYESVGLVPPPRRSPSGYRDYAAEVVDRLRFIRDAQASGLTLAEIQSVLELKDSGRRSCEHTATLIERHLSELDEQITRLQEARAELARLAGRARALDPADCTDPHRCQVIEGA